MPHLTTDLSADGALIDFLVGVSAPHAKFFSAKGQAVPVPVKVRGIIDTGASITCIHTASIASLKLKVTGNVPIITPSTGTSNHLCDQCDVSIILVHPDSNVELATVPIITTDLSGLAQSGIQALIGRDVLAKCLFFYNGASKRFALAF